MQQYLQARKGKEIDSPLEPLERTQFSHFLILGVFDL